MPPITETGSGRCGDTEVNFAFSDEQLALKREARRFLSVHCTSARVRTALAEGRGHDTEAWERASRELGWTSLIVPERYGGAGLGWVELVALTEEIGRTAASLPFFSTVCLATNALLAAADGDQLDTIMPEIAAGNTVATLAFAEDGTANPFAITTVARDVGDGYELSGTKRYVIDGMIADLLLVTARVSGTGGDDGVALFAVDALAPGIERRSLPTLDLTRTQAAIDLHRVRIGPRARMGGAPAIRRALDRAGVALAAEALGGAERCLEMATDYAKTRVQFGRPIGSFQAVKHKLADMLVAVETARSAAYYAAAAAASDDDAELAIAAPLAKSYCTDAFFRCAAESVQIHGGVGFTWEHDAHLFLKRARGSLSLLGSVASDRLRIADAIRL
jgi:alkylation response protein AidB-like acyl-CoA dehydrogenase